MVVTSNTVDSNFRYKLLWLNHKQSKLYALNIVSKPYIYIEIYRLYFNESVNNLKMMNKFHMVKKLKLRRDIWIFQQVRSA